MSSVRQRYSASKLLLVSLEQSSTSMHSMRGKTMNQRPSIHVEALSRTVNKGYYVPSQSKNIIVETEHKTLFRAWLGSEGYWLTLWLNGEPLMILDEVHVSKNLSVTAKSGDRVRVEIQRDGEPSYYKELS